MVACICNGPIGKFIYNPNVMLNVQDINVKGEGDTALTLALRLERFEMRE